MIGNEPTTSPTSSKVALRAEKLDGLLRLRGICVALGDLLIGATALELGYAVGTHNVRHFGSI